MTYPVGPGAMEACLRDTSGCATTTSEPASRPKVTPSLGIWYSLPSTSETILPPVPEVARDEEPARFAAAAATSDLETNYVAPTFLSSAYVSSIPLISTLSP